MIVEIDDDFADDIVVASLANSYVNIAGHLKDPEMCWHEDDLAAWKELVPALEIVLKWYSVDFKAEIKKAKKSK
jgi:hypothetical protein